MADNIGGSLLTLLTATAFIISLLIAASVNISTINYSEIEEVPSNMANYNESVNRRVGSLDELGNAGLPIELVFIFIIPLGTVTIYYIAKSVTSNLPFFGG